MPNLLLEDRTFQENVMIYTEYQNNGLGLGKRKGFKPEFVMENVITDVSFLRK